LVAQLSIVIPTLNAEGHLPACLTALVEGVTAGVVRDLVVSDGGSTDATCMIADEAGAWVLTGPASRGGQLCRAMKRVRGTWCLVLHADTVLAPGWSDVVADHMRNADGPAYFQLALRARGFMPGWVAGWANLRSRVFSLPYGDQGLLIALTDYARTGGYPDTPFMEDVALVRALDKPLTALPITATSSAERYIRTGWVRCGLRNLLALLRYLAGTDPEVLAAAYRRR